MLNVLIIVAAVVLPPSLPAVSAPAQTISRKCQRPGGGRACEPRVVRLSK